MAENSKIGWTDHTFNPWRGCTKVSEGCKHCYAEALSVRNPKSLGVWGPKGQRVIAAEAYWRQIDRWDKDAEKRFEATGERTRVFCASLADVFEGPETMPDYAIEDVNIARLRLWAYIEATPALDWLLLTKRPENVLREGVGDGLFAGGCPKNVWLGTSCEDQKAADERIPHLLKCPVPVRFLSCEPLIGPIDLDAAICGVASLDDDHASQWWRLGTGTHGRDDSWHRIKEVSGPCGQTVKNVASCEQAIHWTILGGESGPGARSMQLGWALSLVEQCKAANVACFTKQLGKAPLGQDEDGGFHDWPVSNGHGDLIEEFPEALRVRGFPVVVR